MKVFCKWLCLCAMAVLMLGAIDPSSAEAGRRHRRRAVHVARPYVRVPVRVHVGPSPYVDHFHSYPYRYYRPSVGVYTPRVRVHVGEYGGGSVRVGRWNIGW